MAEKEQYAVLKYIKEKILKDFPDASLINENNKTVNLKIADSKIRLKQSFDLSGTFPIIYTDDIDNVLHVNEYIETLHNIHEGTEGNENLYTSLKTGSILINGASTDLIFILKNVTKGFLEVTGKKYEVSAVVEVNPENALLQLKLGEYEFDVLVENDQFLVILTPDYDENTPTSIQKEINNDALNIQLEVTAIHKSV